MVDVMVFFLARYTHTMSRPLTSPYSHTGPLSAELALWFRVVVAASSDRK